jgi:hypothetical protein
LDDCDGIVEGNHTLTSESGDSKLPDSSGCKGDTSSSGKLQKNDSGIDVEKSPSTSMRDGLSDRDSVSECCVDSTGFSLSHSESVKSEDSPNSRPDDDADVGASFVENDVDSSDASPNQCGDSNRPDSSAATAVETKMDTTEEVSSSGVNDDEASRSPVVDDEADYGLDHGLDHEVEDEDDEEVVSGMASAKAKRKRRHDHALLSSTDDEDTTDDDDDEENCMEADRKSTDEEEKKEEETRPWPKHKWRALFDLRDREVGHTNCTPPSFFREKVQGSLQMVQRLKLQYKMEYHDGCVNALHFNRIGKYLFMFYEQILL